MTTAIQAVVELRNIRIDFQRSKEAFESKKKMRASERAMTLASYQRKIDALAFAVKLLEDELCANLPPKQRDPI